MKNLSEDDKVFEDKGGFMQQVFEKDQTDWPFEPATDEVLKNWQNKYHLKLPKAMKKLYKVQNGGRVNEKFNDELGLLFGIGDTDDSLCLKPLKSDKFTAYLNEIFSICPELVDRIVDELEDPNLIVPLEGDGHYFVALDYNREGPNGSAEIIHLELEGEISKQVLYRNFTDFLRNKKIEYLDSSRTNGTHVHQVVEDKIKYDLSLKCLKTKLEGLILKYKMYSRQGNFENLEFYFKERLTRKSITGLSGVEALILEEFFARNNIDCVLSKRPPYSWTYIALDRDISNFDYVFSVVVNCFYEGITARDKSKTYVRDLHISNQVYRHEFYEKLKKNKV